MKTTIFTNLFKTTLIKHISIQDAFTIVKEGITDPEILHHIPAGKIQTLTQEGRALAPILGKKHPDCIKRKNNVPVITPHGRFTGNTDDTLIGGQVSGVIYIDLDEQVVDLEKIKSIPYLIGYWKSFSGLGYSLFFAVDPDTYTPDQVNDVIVQVAELNGLKYDPNAKALSRGVLLPFNDQVQDVFYNSDFSNHKYVSKRGNESTGVSVSFDQGSQKGEMSHINIKREDYNDSHFTFLNKRQLKYRSGISDIDKSTYTITEETEDYIYIKEGLPYLEIFLGIAENYKIKIGARSRRLRTICGILLTINPWASEKQIYSTINMINRDKCQQPLNEKEVEGIVRNIFKQFRSTNPDGLSKLDVSKYAKTKYLWFYDDCKLSRREKLQISAKKTWERRKEGMPDMDELIQEAIICLYEEEKKITQKEVAKLINKSDRHVKSYWSDEIKADVKELNQTIKTNSKPIKNKRSKPSAEEPASTPEPPEITAQEPVKTADNNKEEALTIRMNNEEQTQEPTKGARQEPEGITEVGSIYTDRKTITEVHHPDMLKRKDEALLLPTILANLEQTTIEIPKSEEEYGELSLVERTGLVFQYLKTKRFKNLHVVKTKAEAVERSLYLEVVDGDLHIFRQGEEGNYDPLNGEEMYRRWLKEQAGIFEEEELPF